MEGGLAWSHHVRAFEFCKELYRIEPSQQETVGLSRLTSDLPLGELATEYKGVKASRPWTRTVSDDLFYGLARLGTSTRILE